MRFLVKATMPVEAGNALIRDAHFEKRLSDIFTDLKPEAVYFLVEKGQRTIYCFVNIEGAHQLPMIVEPFWLSFKADVEAIPVMDQEDMKKAGPSIEKAVKRH